MQAVETINEKAIIIQLISSASIGYHSILVKFYKKKIMENCNFTLNRLT